MGTKMGTAPPGTIAGTVAVKQHTEREPALLTRTDKACRSKVCHTLISPPMQPAGARNKCKLSSTREGVKANGYKLERFAPQPRGAEDGRGRIETSTLQVHLTKRQGPDTGERRLYVLDASSLASTKLCMSL